MDAGRDLERTLSLLMPAIRNDKSFNEFVNGGSSLLSSKLAKSKATGSPSQNNTKSLDAERRKIN